MEAQPDLSRYACGKIYSIRSHQCDKYYIGSTCLDLYKRLFNHRHKYKSHLNDKYNYVSSFEILKYDDHYIELIEDYPCKSKRELEKREGQLQRQYKNDIVNHYYAHNTPQQLAEHKKQYFIKHYEINKEQLIEYQKQHYEANKEQIAEQRKQYREANKEQILEYQKQYSESHKDKMIEYQKKYYEDNKEKLAEQKKQYYQKKKAETN